MEKSPGLGLVSIFGEAGDSGRAKESPTSEGRIPRPEISQGLPGQGRGFGDPRCTNDMYVYLCVYVFVKLNKDQKAKLFYLLHMKETSKQSPL